MAPETAGGAGRDAPSARSGRIEDLFHAACALKGAARAAFLARECEGDGALLAEVTELVAAAAADGFLESPAAWRAFADGAAERAPPAAEPGLPHQRLGEFRLIRKIGEGGMGTVYLAVQEPIGRDVAVKLIRADRAFDREARARFLREAEAAARLSHPNIVTVYFVGAAGAAGAAGDPTATPYIAMELLDGRPLDELMREAVARGETIALETRVGWIAAIAGALAAAHAAGIVHRDVKPANIQIVCDGQIVGDGQIAGDGRGFGDERPKLLDFGIARRLEVSSFTLTGQFRGTPYYASPEQIKASGPLDGRTDVYSLGATLYELVTGRLPFAGGTTEQVFRQILDDDPLPPRRLDATIPKDLETIILKALEKSLERRYPAMQELHADLLRFLAGEPVLARPRGPLLRLFRAARRRPAWSAAAAVAVLALGGFLAYLTLYSWPRIVGERNRALAALGAADDARRETERQRQQAVGEMELSEATLEFFLDMLGEADPRLARGRDPTVGELLDRTAANLDRRFPDRPDVRGRIHDAVAATYHNLGRREPARRHAEAALELLQGRLGPEHPDVLEARHSLAVQMLGSGEYAAAEEAIGQVLKDRVAVLGPSDPKTLESRRYQALVLHHQGRLADAAVLFAQLARDVRALAPDQFELLASVLSEWGRNVHDQGLLDQAEPLYREALGLQRTAVGDHVVDTLTTLGNYAMLVQEQGRLDEAEALHREAVEGFRTVYGADHPNTQVAKTGLAYLMMARDRLGDAEELMRQVLADQRRTLGDADPDVLASLANLTTLVHAQGRHEEALALAEEGVALARELFPDGHLNAALMGFEYAVCLRDVSRFAEAEPVLLESYHELREALGDDHPTVLQARAQVVLFYEWWDEPGKGAEFLEREP